MTDERWTLHGDEDVTAAMVGGHRPYLSTGAGLMFPTGCECGDRVAGWHKWEEHVFRSRLDAVAPAIAARALLTEAEWWKDIPHTILTGPLISDILIYHARFGPTGWIPADARARAEETGP